MPSTSKKQQTLFRMALAVRKGDLERSKANQAVLSIVDGDMTDKQIEDFTVLKDSMIPLKDYLNEAYANGLALKPKEYERKIFIIVKPGFLEKAPEIMERFEKAGFTLYQTRTKVLTPGEARSLYKVHRKEGFYKALWEYMSGGPSMGITFQYKGSTKEAFKTCSDLKDEIRKLWSEDDKRNVMHSSDNAEAMEFESSFYCSRT